MYRVFVYGTLLKGMPRAFVLDKQTFIGTAKTRAEFTMVSLGGDSFPGVIPTGNSEIVGEVYKVDEECLALLDRIEGFIPSEPEDSLYIRRLTTLQNGQEVHIYYLNDSGFSYKKVESGDWVQYLTTHRDWRRY